MKAAAALAITAAVLLAGCAGPTPASVPRPTAAAATKTATLGPRAPAPVAAASWPAGDPAHPRRDDFTYLVASQYDTWTAGKPWRVTGAGWDPGNKVTLSLQRPDAGVGERGTGSPLTVQADSNGQFVAAYKVPAAATPGNYEITAQGPGGFHEVQAVEVIAAW